MEGFECLLAEVEIGRLSKPTENDIAKDGHQMNSYAEILRTDSETSGNPPKPNNIRFTGLPLDKISMAGNVNIEADMSGFDRGGLPRGESSFQFIRHMGLKRILPISDGGVSNQVARMQRTTIREHKSHAPHEFYYIPSRLLAWLTVFMINSLIAVSSNKCNQLSSD